MTGFEPRSSGIGSDRAIICATTTAPNIKFSILIIYKSSIWANDCQCTPPPHLYSERFLSIFIILHFGLFYQVFLECVLGTYHTQQIDGSCNILKSFNQTGEIMGAQHKDRSSLLRRRCLDWAVQGSLDSSRSEN